MSESKSRPPRRPATRAVHGPSPHPDGAFSTPIVHSSVFAFPDVASQQEARERGAAGAFYQRLGHPTLHACEEHFAALAEAERALVFPSGMAAISTAWLTHLSAGDHFVLLRQSYGGTLDVARWGAERLGWTFDQVDAREPETWEAAFRPNTRLFHVESPTNPTVCVVDLAAAARLAHRRGALLSVDNTFASPVGQRPLELGADFVVYSATKSIGGHSDLLAGMLTGAKLVIDRVYALRSIIGAVPGPETAWLIERSLKTLPLRVERANANALELARRLSRHPQVARVFYPGLETHPGHDVAARQMTLGFGPVLAFEAPGGLAGAESVVRALEVVRHAASLGGVESLALLPLHTSHRRLNAAERAAAGIPDGIVRVSVGIEDVEDLWADLEQAIAHAPAPARA